MTFSAGDTTLLRHHKHWVKPIVNAVPQVTIATAQINQSTFTNPVYELTVDSVSAGWTTDVKVGHAFKIGTSPGGSDICWGIVRKAPTSTKLYIDAKGLGDPGYVQNLRASLADNYYITVIKYRPPWGILPSIRGKIFYKFFDVTYTDEGKNPDVIPNIGEWRQGFVDSATGKLRLTFTAANAHVWSGRTLSSRTWDFDGGTVISGSTTSEVVVVDFDPGFYEVTCTFVDSKGTSSEGYRYVWANSSDPANSNSPLSYRYEVTGILRDTQVPEGRSLAIRFENQLLEEVLFPGQAFLVTEQHTWNGQGLSDESEIANSYVGYASSRTVPYSLTDKGVEVDTRGPLLISNDIPIDTQAIQEKASPRRWTEVTSTLSNPVGAYYYLTRNHALYLFRGHDLDFDNNLLSERRRIYNFTQRDLGGQFNLLGKIFLGQVGAKSSGKVRLVKHPFYFTNANRNALSTKWSWAAGDITERGINLASRYQSNVGKVHGGAFTVTPTGETTAFAALAPGYQRTQSGRDDSMTSFTIQWQGTRDDTQDEVNRIVGHHHARLNAEIPSIVWDADRNIDIAEPCDLDEWHELSLAASYDPLNLGFLSKRLIPTRVYRTWNDVGTGWTKRINIQAEIETFGFPGVTINLNRGGANFHTWNPWILDPYERKLPNFGFDTDDLMTCILAWSSTGKLGRCLNFLEERPLWEDISSLVGGYTVLDADINRFSDYFTVGTTSDMEAIVLTWDSGNALLKVYSLPDINQSTPSSGTLLDSFSVSQYNFSGKGRVICSRTESGHWLVAYKNQRQTLLQRSNDSGSTWTPVTVGSLAPSADSDESKYSLGVTNWGQTTFIQAPTGSLDADNNIEYKLYAATSKTGSFSAVGSIPAGFKVFRGGMDMSTSGTAMVSMTTGTVTTPTNTLAAVDFDSGYPTYTVSGSTSSGEAFHSGKGSDVAYASTPNGGSQLASVAVTIDLEADYNFDKVVFWAGSQTQVNSAAPTYGYIVTLKDKSTADIAQYRQDFDGTPLATISSAITVTAANLGIDDDTPVRYVVVNLFYSWTTEIGSGNNQVYLDDIDITATLIDRDEERYLYTASAGGSWTQRYTFQRVPYYTYGIATARGLGDLSAIAKGKDEEVPNFISSDDIGVSWTLGRNLPNAVGLKRGGTAALVFGYNIMALSSDGGVTFYSRNGTWSITIGPLEWILGMTGAM